MLVLIAFSTMVTGDVTTTGLAAYSPCPDLHDPLNGVIDRTLSCGNHGLRNACTKQEKCNLQECQAFCTADDDCTTLQFKMNGACKLFRGCDGSKSYSVEGVTLFRIGATLRPACPNNTDTTTVSASAMTSDLASTKTPTTTTSTTPTTATGPICPPSCLGSSCDAHLLAGVDTTCTKLEDAGCDCRGCTCSEAVTKPPESTPTARNVTFKYTWTMLEGTDCGVINGSKVMSNVIHIGERGHDFDHDVTPLDCKVKCAESPECGGFTYHTWRQFCRYKHRQPRKQYSHTKSQLISCYIYNQPISDDSSAVGRKPIDEEEEALELGFGVLAGIIVVGAMVAGIVVFIVVFLKRNKGKREIVVRGLLVRDEMQKV